ncbi:hypothetical protein [Sporosarcina psychrophila]|uniref:hypothetical protein n=1 Tax=Sporosarcina psychrophila TaxID=1476 RepID=UPI003BB0F2DA
MTSPIELLQEKCRTLRLAETAKELPALLRNAESGSWTYLVFCQESGHELMSSYFKKPTALRLLYFHGRAVKKPTALPRKL